MNRAFLLLLAVGLFIAVWQRNKGGPEAAPASGAKPTSAAPTNSTVEHSLVSFEQPIHK